MSERYGLNTVPALVTGSMTNGLILSYYGGVYDTSQGMGNAVGASRTTDSLRPDAWRGSALGSRGVLTSSNLQRRVAISSSGVPPSLMRGLGHLTLADLHFKVISPFKSPAAAHGSRGTGLEALSHSKGLH